MMDQYKEQYKKETEQIHAPADLIARTKAAMREEEARIQKERLVQATKLNVQEAPAVQKSRGRGMMARKWAYPLTVVAAIFILVSVSLMMRGLGKSGSDSAPYELASEADSGAAESAEVFEEAFPEEALVAEGASEEATEGSAFDSETATTEMTEDAVTDSEAASAEMAGGAVNDAETTSAAPSAGGTAESLDEAKRAAPTEELSSELESLEDAMSQKQEEKLADGAVESVTIKKVWNRPAFVNSEDMEVQTYEDVVFQVIKEGDEWIAYVESESGGGYVIRGEAETIEAFLKAGYQRLLEISF